MVNGKVIALALFMKFIIAATMFFMGCSSTRSASTASATNSRQSNSNNSIPTCIQTYIDTFRRINQKHVGSIQEYEFQGKLVYAFTPSKMLADGSIKIVSSDCKSMCNVAGFAGLMNSNCNGDNFFEKAILKRTLWAAPK
jgi:hypothetical protein